MNVGVAWQSDAKIYAAMRAEGDELTDLSTAALAQLDLADLD